MVRFARFRTRSVPRSSLPVRGPSSHAPTKPVPAPSIDEGDEEEEVVETRKLSDLSVLIDRQRELAVEEKELQAIVSKVDSAHERDRYHIDDEEDINLNVNIVVAKNRTSSSKNSVTRPVRARTNSLNKGSESRNSNNKEPLWKRRLKKVKNEENNAPDESPSSSPKGATHSRRAVSPNQSSRVLDTANMPKSATEQQLESRFPETPTRKDDETEESNEDPKDIYNPTKTSLADAEPTADDFTLATPSVYTESTNPVSVGSPRIDEEDDDDDDDRNRHGRYQQNPDSVSSLGDDEVTMEDRAQCSVALLANDAFTSAAIMILQCNEQCANEGLIQGDNYNNRRGKRGRRRHNGHLENK